MEEKKYADARALCEEMLRQRPGFADCHLQMSKIAAAGGNLDAALTAAAKAVAVGPKNERAHLQLAALLQERGDLDGAIAHFRQALAMEPNAPDTRMLLGRALADKGQLDEAASLLGTTARTQFRKQCWNSAGVPFRPVCTLIMSNEASGVIRDDVKPAHPHARFYVDGWAVFEDGRPRGESEEVDCRQRD